MTKINCPTPGKTRYATEEAAGRTSRQLELSTRRRLRVYLCACGWHHLTHSRRTSAQHERYGLPADPTGAPDDKFRRVVWRDIEGKATPQQSEALRRPENAARWLEVLSVIRMELRDQVLAVAGRTDTATLAWVHGMQTVRAKVSRRRKTANGILRRAAGASVMEQRAAGSE